MLKEVRHALADTASAGMPEGRILPYKPLAVNMPQSGVFGWVEGAASYVAPWMSFSADGHAQVNLEVHLLVVNTGNPERDYDRLDDLLDPQSTAANVFGAVMEDRTLGIPVSDFNCKAHPLAESVLAPELVSIGPDGSNLTAYELILPVQVIVQRS